MVDFMGDDKAFGVGFLGEQGEGAVDFKEEAAVDSRTKGIRQGRSSI